MRDLRAWSEGQRIARGASSKRSTLSELQPDTLSSVVTQITAIFPAAVKYASMAVWDGTRPPPKCPLYAPTSHASPHDGGALPPIAADLSVVVTLFDGLMSVMQTLQVGDIVELQNVSVRETSPASSWV